MDKEALKSFFNALNNFHSKLTALDNQQEQLMEKKEQIKSVIKSKMGNFDKNNLSKNNSLTESISKLSQSIQLAFYEWDKNVEETLPMQELSKQFQDKIIFLVFGKVNSGKSSFCNQVAELYQDIFPNDSTSSFRIDRNGKVHKLTGKFTEGFTETTTEIQGIELGKNFVLLDSPGLHSVVSENGDVTYRYIDSADAVLWLTPSISPGQVQELNELKFELEKGKPLLPIITRSDWVDEDESKETQELISIVKDKSVENRKLQEEDVVKRLSEFKDIKFEKGKVKEPISISVYTYKEYRSLKESGLARLFTEMSKLVSTASEYKIVKAQKQIENFIKYNVLSKLDGSDSTTIISQIDKVLNDTSKVIEKLDNRKLSITSNVKLAVNSKLDRIINKHKSQKNKSAILNEINEIINKELNNELKSTLSDFVSSINNISAKIDENTIADFKDNVVEYERVKGASKQSMARSVGSLGGAAGGAAIGSMIAPGIGTVIGGVIGGIGGNLLGNTAGEYFIETETVRDVVGVSFEDLEKSLKLQIDLNINNVVTNSINSIKTEILSLKTKLEELRNEIKNLVNKFS